MKTNSKLLFCALFAVVFSMLAATPALADWDPSMPAKWVQMPDLQTGMDVNASWNPMAYPWHKIVADDFVCTDTGPLTDIHIWGSWLRDNIDRNAVVKLSIHQDVPAGVDAPYSHPAPVPLWEYRFTPAEYTVRPWGAGATERFLDPNLGEVIGFDTIVWQYNFDMPATHPFIQEGSPTHRVVYWLDVQVQPTLTTPEPAIFGWKTSRTIAEFMLDDSVYADTEVFGGPVIGPAPPPVFWKELFDPTTGISLNQAFVINGIPEPSTIVMLVMGAFALALYGWRRRS
jgi:hypothetical protein